MHIRSGSPLLIGKIDKNERVVYDDPRERNDPKKTEETQAVPEEDMADNRAHDAERNADHDNQRLEVAFEGDSKQYKDQGQC